ncbi:MAG: hypothetical protein ACRDYZ_11965 [Acidimicrobiales bacterium]
MSGWIVVTAWTIFGLAALFICEYTLKRSHDTKFERHVDDALTMVAEQHRLQRREADPTPIHDQLVCDAHEHEFL